jgi:hypothetical protein
VGTEGIRSLNRPKGIDRRKVILVTIAGIVARGSGHTFALSQERPSFSDGVPRNEAQNGYIVYLMASGSP